MARSSTNTMAKVLERLELDRPLVVTSAELDGILREEEIATPAHVFASRMRDRGWLLPTGQRGVWEFAPAAVAGPYSSMDPLLQLKAFSAAHPNIEAALTMHAAAWALGLTDRAPITIDVAVLAPLGRISMPDNLTFHVFAPKLPTVEARGVSILAAESIFVHMAAKPTAVHSWQSASEWLPELAYEMSVESTLAELEGRKPSVQARTGYLIQGMRPDIADALDEILKPSAKVRFGPRTKSLRNDEKWKVADTILPFDPREMEALR